MNRFTAPLMLALLPTAVIADTGEAAQSSFTGSLPEVLILAALIIIGLRFLRRKLSALLQALRMKSK